MGRKSPGPSCPSWRHLAEDTARRPQNQAGGVQGPQAASLWSAGLLSWRCPGAQDSRVPEPHPPESPAWREKDTTFSVSQLPSPERPDASPLKYLRGRLHHRRGPLCLRAFVGCGPQASVSPGWPHSHLVFASVAQARKVHTTRESLRPGPGHGMQLGGRPAVSKAPRPEVTGEAGW